MADTIYLVRHAKAGERRLWEGEDLDRPLSKRGRRQAKLLARRLAAEGATECHSSPYVRCVETLEPLASRIDTTVVIEPRLIEGAEAEPVVELLTEISAGAVLCSHGDIVPAVMGALTDRGTEIVGEADWRKATVWVLERRKRRGFITATVWSPP